MSPPDRFGLAMPGPVSEPLAAATRRVEARADELVAVMVDALRDIPEYAAVEDPVVWEEIRQHTAASVGLYFNILREGRLPRREGMKTGTYFAKRRVEQGISLPALRAAYVSGTRIEWGALLDEVRDDPALREELLERSSWAMSHVDAVTAAIADAYYEAQRDSRHRDQLIRDLFDEIVDGRDAGALQARANLANLEIDCELRTVVFRWVSAVPGGSPFDGLPPVPAVVACADAAGIPADRVLAARRANELLLVVPWPEPVAHLEKLRGSLAEAVLRLVGDTGGARAGVSGRAEGVSALREAYRESARAVELGEMLDPAAAIHFYDDFVLHDLFDSAPAQGDRLIAQMLDPLLRLGEVGERLIETLDAYLRSGRNQKIAAAALAIHRNTLTYRLEQIRRETRYDLTDPAQRLRLEAALRFLELRRRRRPSA